MLAVGLGFTCHLVAMISNYLDIPLRYPMLHRGSRSSIYDRIMDKLNDSERELVFCVCPLDTIHLHLLYYWPNQWDSFVLLAGVCRRCLLSSVVCNAAGRRARGWLATAGSGSWAVGRPTLHGGPVRLRPVRATSCCVSH